MLYVIIAEEYDFFSKEKELLKKKLHIESEYEILNSEHAIAVFEEFYSDGFFEKPTFCLIYKYLFDEMNENMFLPQIELLSETKHLVCIYEKTHSKELDVFIGKHSITPIEFKKTTVEKKAPTPFLFTDYVIAKNKKDAWIEYMALQKQNIEVSQILGGLIWAIKSLLLVLSHTNVTQTGLNPYVFSKIDKMKSLWTKTEGEQLLKKLLHIQGEEQFDEEAQAIKLEQLIFNLA